MPRELNSELFKSLQRELELAEGRKDQEAPAGRSNEISASFAENPFQTSFQVSEKDWAAVIEQIRKLTRQQKDHELSLQRLDSQTTEALGSTKVRVERIGAGAQRIDEKSQMRFSEINERLASLSSKVTERKISDQKIEQLLARHNQTVQNFELRLQQMQKLVNEQEMQLVNYRSALTEAKREMEKLRRKS